MTNSQAGGPSGVDDSVLLDLHRRMVRIRTFEEQAGKLQETGKIPGALHLYVGEEASRFAAMLHEKVPEAGVDMPYPEIAVMRIVSASGPDFRRGWETFCDICSRRGL